MNEPLPPDLEQMMNAERASSDPPADRKRVLSRLESSVAALAVGAGIGAAVGVAGGTAGTVAGFVKGIASHAANAVRGKFVATAVAVSLGAAGAGTVGYTAGVRTEKARHLATTSQPTSARTTPLSTTSPPSPGPIFEAPVGSGVPTSTAAKTVAAPTAVAQPGSERDATLADELTFVQTARTALVRGDAAGALASAERHRQKYPGGRLSEERESIAIQALARLGHGAEARSRAADFERVYPRSMLLPVISRALGSIP